MDDSSNYGVITWVVLLVGIALLVIRGIGNSKGAEEHVRSNKAAEAQAKLERERRAAESEVALLESAAALLTDSGAAIDLLLKHYKASVLMQACGLWDLEGQLLAQLSTEPARSSCQTQPRRIGRMRNAGCPAMSNVVQPRAGWNWTTRQMP